MGRDLLGDDTPPEEVNILTENSFYGWPYCYGNKVQDKKFNSDERFAQVCQNSIAPKVEMQAHSAPLGIAFTPSAWPKEYQNSILVAFHGSWNRSTPTGYKIVRIVLDVNQKPIKTEDFIGGWLKNNTALGRPVDILFTDKGVGYISDDKAGIVYTLRYVK